MDLHYHSITKTMPPMKKCNMGGGLQLKECCSCCSCMWYISVRIASFEFNSSHEEQTKNKDIIGLISLMPISYPNFVLLISPVFSAVIHLSFWAEVHYNSIYPEGGNHLHTSMNRHHGDVENGKLYYTPRGEP